MSRLFSGTPFDRPTVCDTCGKPPADCRCARLPDKKRMADRPGGKHAGQPRPGLVLTPQNSNPPADQAAKVRLEKRKGGRAVTVITGLEHPANDLDALCKNLKASLGTGGSVQGRTLEIQGEKTAEVHAHLQAAGFKSRVV